MTKSWPVPAPDLDNRGRMDQQQIMSYILPLILLLSHDLIHVDHLPQLHEPEVPEELGEDVNELPASLDELDDDLSSIDAVHEEVELCFHSRSLGTPWECSCPPAC